MTEEWMAVEVLAGAAISHGLAPELQNPAHLGVRLGTAVGRTAVTIYRKKGREAAQAFLSAVSAIVNQEMIHVDLTEEIGLWPR